jgi:hypothetical protein
MKLPRGTASPITIPKMAFPLLLIALWGVARIWVSKHYFTFCSSLYSAMESIAYPGRTRFTLLSLDQQDYYCTFLAFGPIL